MRPACPPTALLGKPWCWGTGGGGDAAAGTTARCRSPGCIPCVLVLGDTGSRRPRRGAAREGTLRLPRVLEQTQRNSRCLHARRLVQNRYHDGFPTASGSEGRGVSSSSGSSPGVPRLLGGVWRWGGHSLAGGARWARFRKPGSGRGFACVGHN